MFLILAGFFITNAVLAEFIGVKIFSLEDSLGVPRANLPIFGGTFSFHLTAGVLIWPVVFIMTDIINEYYGPKGVRFLSYLASGLIVFAFLIVFASIQLAPSEFFRRSTDAIDPNISYARIFGQGLWIIVGSLLAFLIGQVLDVLVFHRIKKATGERLIWLRTTGSTLVSQLIDSFVVLYVAFYLGPLLEGDDHWSLNQILVTGTGNYIYKFVVAILLTPVIYLVHYRMEKYLGEDVALRMRREAMGGRHET